MIAPLTRIVMLTAVAFGAAATSQAQDSPAPRELPQSDVRPYARARTEQWTLRSKAGRTYQIFVSLPKAPPPASGYPVLYVLDADTHFATLADTVRMGERSLGPVVVVGIGYPNEADVDNRAFDLTPKAGSDPASWSPASRKWSPPGGGAEAFFDFIESDLKPVIASSFKIDATRQALFGHSLGGLFVLHVLFSHPDAFSTYVAASPSIWWSGRHILTEAAPFLKAQAGTGGHLHRLLIAVGALESQLSPEQLRNKATGGQVPDVEEMKELDMVGSAAALAAGLRRANSSALKVEYVMFPDETHLSIVPAYLSRGARFALNGWAEDRRP